MKSLTSTAIVALTAGVIGFAGAIPAATAQQQPGQGQQMPQQMQPYGYGQFRHPGMGFRMGNQMRFGNQMRMNQMRGQSARGAGLLALVCSEKGAERLEIGLVRLSYRVDLTDEQQPLFDDLRTAALTAQTQFADACRAARSTAAARTTAPDPVAGLKARIEPDKARLAALETVLPKFEAFYGSLTDEQKAQLAPRRAAARQQGFRPRMPGFPGMGQHPGMMTPPAAGAPQQGQPSAPPQNDQQG